MPIKFSQKVERSAAMEGIVWHCVDSSVYVRIALTFLSSAEP
jgi:hypothetical protein